jgi:AbrB family looped-hinge helix DNA binding protein
MLVKVGMGGQITLPDELRRKMEINAGDHLVIILRGDRLILHPIRQTLLDLRGSVRVTKEQSFAEIRRQVIDRHGSRSAVDEG